MEDRTDSFQEAEDKPGGLPMSVSSDLITAVPRRLTGKVRTHTLAPSQLRAWDSASWPGCHTAHSSLQGHTKALCALSSPLPPLPIPSPVCSPCSRLVGSGPLASIATLLEYECLKGGGQAPPEALSHLPCYLLGGTSHPITITHEMHPFCVNVNKDPPHSS